MCEQGVNVGQLKLAIGQSDDAVAVVQKWLHQLQHLADHGKREDVSAALSRASSLLADARTTLDEAIGSLEGTRQDSSSVELV